MNQINAWRFRIPLADPVVLKGKSYATREGVLFERHGVWAEASPLPGFSKDSADDVIEAIKGNENQSAAFNFAMCSLNHPINSPLSVPYNSLLMGNPKEILTQAEKCGSSSCQTVKMKIGRNALHQDIELVQNVRQMLAPDIKLRLDANQAWAFDEAIEFLSATRALDIEYIEEPIRDANQLEELYSKTGVRYALDETLLHETTLTSWPNVTALICKPTILGGRKFVEKLAESGKPIVFSSAFESGIGVSHIVQLAAEFSPEVAAGLDTLDWISDDLLDCSPRKQNGQFLIDGPPVAVTSTLERIEW
ncbi:MAG: o-succinylbenzoate synthase [Planctomycetota bacterium]